jgi:hypothetical protein
MRPVVVHARGRIQPRSVEDLSDGAQPLARDALVAAGQALTWQWMFNRGAFTAIPLSRAAAVLVARDPHDGLTDWHERFTRGLAHRMAAELTIASVAAGLMSEAPGPRQAGEDRADDNAELLDSAIEGLLGVFTDLSDGHRTEDIADRVVADTVRTHAALVGTPLRQRTSVERQDGFAVHTVRTASGVLSPSDLEEIRGRVGLPWPARDGERYGRDLGLVRWRATMQARGEQMWCWQERGRGGEEGNVLVTRLWLRSPASRATRGSDSRTRSG